MTGFTPARVHDISATTVHCAWRCANTAGFLDGGGVRGLSELLILKRLMHRIHPQTKPLPKPCEYFDAISGTSTGG